MMHVATHTQCPWYGPGSAVPCALVTSFANQLLSHWEKKRNQRARVIYSVESDKHNAALRFRVKKSINFTDTHTVASWYSFRGSAKSTRYMLKKNFTNALSLPGLYDKCTAAEHFPLTVRFSSCPLLYWNVCLLRLHIALDNWIFVL